MSKKTILLLALGTLVVFGGLGIVFIPLARQVEVLGFLSGPEKIWVQILIGLVIGFVTAKAGWQITNLPMMEKNLKFFAGLIRPVKLTNVQIVFISLCAGVGEELLFRGAIQPLLGIWLTSILFVLIHGYLNPFNLPLTYYGIYMVLVIGVLGLMTEHVGILTAMIAHTIIDIVLLRELSNVPLSGNDDVSEE